MKKLTYGFIKKSFEKEGYTLLSKEYKNNKTKLDYLCPKGHIHRVSWNCWNTLGNRCPYCYGNTKLDIEQVRKSFEKEGYVLLSNEYKNAYTKLDYICSKGHKHSITWTDWHYGKRCWYCNGNIKPTYDFVKYSFEKEGYTLLSKEYINNRTKLKYVCPKGHIHSISFGKWGIGRRCPYCSKKIKKTIKDVRNSFESAGYILLSTKYINNHTKLKYICHNGHKHSIIWTDWARGVRCPTCYCINNMGENHPSWKGGISFEPYCEAWKDLEYKKDIRNRDGNKCLNPYCDSPDSRDLTIHHIDYNKKNCKPNNLITVCRSCNSKANKDRTWHKAWYQAVIYRRYFNDKG